MRWFARCAALGLLPFAHIHTCAGASAMAQAMQMDDAALIGKVWLDQFEWRGGARSDAAAWQGEGWYGGDYNKAWVRSEGAAESGRTQSARAELFWDHLVARWWSVQAGAREDFGVGPTRAWAAVGIRGLAPQGVAVEASVYAGGAAHTAARLKVDYELLFTQRLVLTPEIELNVYGKADPARDIGAGVSDFEVALRMRYEVRREIAPYAGIVWARRRGAASPAAAGADELRLALGLRVWL